MRTRNGAKRPETYDTRRELNFIAGLGGRDAADLDAIEAAFTDETARRLHAGDERAILERRRDLLSGYLEATSRRRRWDPDVNAAAVLRAARFRLDYVEQALAQLQAWAS